MYEHALKQMNLPPEQTIFIDDGVENLAGAQKCGIQPVLITAKPNSENSDRYPSIKKLSELLEILPNWFAHYEHNSCYALSAKGEVVSKGYSIFASRAQRYTHCAFMCCYKRRSQRITWLNGGWRTRASRSSTMWRISPGKERRPRAYIVLNMHWPESWCAMNAEPQDNLGKKWEEGNRMALHQSSGAWDEAVPWITYVKGGGKAYESRRK